MTSQLRKDRLAVNGIIVTDAHDRRRLARSLVLGGVHYDAGHSCAVVRRVATVRVQILIDGQTFTVHMRDVMR